MFNDGAEHKRLLIQSLRAYVLPIFTEKRFEIAPLVHRGPADREAEETLPFGRLRRAREDGVDLVQIQIARGRAAFRIMAGIAPGHGLMTLTGYWAPEDLLVDWLGEYFVMYAWPRWRIWFSVWHWPGRDLTREYERLASRVARFTPEIESALREGRLGPHMRRVVIPRSAPRGQ